MAFIKEKIEKEEDIELYNSFSLKNPLTKEIRKHDKRSVWTVDRKKEIYFCSFGGMNTEEIPLFFALIINNQKVIIEAQTGGNGSRETGVETWWKVSKIYIPQDLKLNKEAVEFLLKEAIEAYDRGVLNDTVVKSTVVEINSNIIFINGEVY